MIARRVSLGAVSLLGNWKYCPCCHHSLVVYLMRCFCRWYRKVPMVPNHCLGHYFPGCWLTSSATVILHATALAHANARMSYFKSSLLWYVWYHSIHQATMNVRHSPHLLYHSSIGTLLQKKKHPFGGGWCVWITWDNFNAILPTHSSLAVRNSQLGSAQLCKQLAQPNRGYGVIPNFMAMVGIRLWLDLRNSTRSEAEVVLVIAEVKS